MSELQEGCIVTWTSPKTISFATVRTALQLNGFDDKLAKEMAPRSAFARAAKQLDDDRIIRKVQETDSELEFQFTKEYLAQGELKYDREFSLYLSKANGTVRCESGEMQDEAQRLVDHHLANREASDVTRLIQKIFEAEKGDLIPVRAQGGCYFVPPTHSDLVRRVNDLLVAIGGSLGVWEISMKSEATAAAVEGATLTHMLSEIDQFRETLATVDQESKPAVKQRRLHSIALFRQKLMSYAPLLRGMQAEVDSAINEVESVLNQKVTGSFEESAEVTSEIESMSNDELLAALDAPQGDIPLPDDLEFDGMPPTEVTFNQLFPGEMPAMPDLDTAEQMLDMLDMPALPE